MFNARAEARHLASLLSRERDAMAEFIVALAGFDRQKGWAELVDPLRDGRLCLTTVVELARVLTTENCAAVLPRYFHLSRREAAEVSAAIQPVDRLPLRKVVTVVGAPRKAAVATTPARDIPVAVQPREPLLRVSPPAQVSIVPLDEDLRRLLLTGSRRFLAKVGEARNALSHSHPGASTEAILLAGLELLIARHRKRRGVGAAASANPRGAAPDRSTCATQRQVWERDGGRCQWPLDGGGICGSTVQRSSTTSCLEDSAGPRTRRTCDCSVASTTGGRRVRPTGTTSSTDSR